MPERGELDPPSQKSHKAGKRNFALGIALVFLMLGSVGMVRHEMWRDEIQAWLIARDSTSFADILSHLKYEGHLPLWQFTLFPLTRLSTSPHIMQVWHLLLAAAVIYLFARCSPFTRTQKLLFAFGYFAFYEYAIISRCYVLSVLFLFLFCMVYTTHPKRFVLSGLALMVAAHTSAHALFVIVPLLGIMIFDLANGTVRPRPAEAILGLALPVLGIVTAALPLTPPLDCSIYTRWRFGFNGTLLWRSMGTVTRAYVPVPEPSVAFWETNLLDAWPGSDVVTGLLGLGIVLWGIWFLSRVRVVAVAFCLATVGLCGFSYTHNLGGLRHNGMLFVMFLVGAWLTVSHSGTGEAHESAEAATGPKRFRADPAWRWRRRSFTLLLAIQAVAGVLAAALDWRYPFSRAEAAAEFIREQGLDAMPIMGHERPKVSPVCGYLGGKMFYPSGDRVASFSRWDKQGDRHVSIDFAMRRAREFYREDVLFVSSFPVGKSAAAHYGLRFVADFRGSIAPGESYWLYVLKGTTPEPDSEAEEVDGPRPSSPAEPGPARFSVSQQALTVATPTGDVRKDISVYVNSIGMPLVLVPSGRFRMGSRTGDRDEEPVDEVTITRPFYMGMHEVTQQQYERITGSNPSYLKAPSHPVERVTWHDAVEFCRVLSGREGRTYRLPTEAEWEYACRAGTRTRHYWGDFAVPHCSWFAATSRFRSHPVGGKRPNAFGLYDMNGNVREWCASVYRPYPFERDGRDADPETRSFRVLRGGGWGDLDSRSTSSYRAFFDPSYADIFVGFRVVAEVQE